MYNLNERKLIKERISKLNAICFTIDIDWAPEYAIENIITFFMENHIPLTVFSTHKSPYLESIAKTSKIDIGIHPNFIFPSTQGSNQDAIISFCQKIHPNAESFRCHRWYSNNDIYDKLYSLGFKYESNVCTAFDLLPPFIHRSGLISFPTFFEDGAYLYHQLDLNFENTKFLFDSRGLRIIDLHPMHFAINTPNFKYMRNIKDSLTPNEWNNLNCDNIKKLLYRGLGITDYIKHLVEFIHIKRIPVASLRELYNQIT